MRELGLEVLDDGRDRVAFLAVVRALGDEKLGGTTIDDVNRGGQLGFVIVGKSGGDILRPASLLAENATSSTKLLAGRLVDIRRGLDLKRSINQ